MRPQYSRTDIQQMINDQLNGELDATRMNRIINDSVRQVLADIDLRSTKKSIMLSLDGRNLISSEANDGVFGSSQRAQILAEADRYQFYAPSDLKQTAIIDIRDRYSKNVQYELTLPEEFLRRKTGYSEQVAVDETSFIKQMLVSGVPTVTKKMLHNCDTYNGNGTWTASTDSSSMATVTSDYVEGVGAIGVTLVTGAATGVLTNSGFTAVDISNLTDYSVYVWVYIPMATSLTSFTLKWGSDSSNYYSRTVTRNHDNTAFYVGWNLLRFPSNDATQTGTVTTASIGYLQLTIVKASGNTGTTGWIVDRIMAQQDIVKDIFYYSKYGWQNTSGGYLENSSSDTDLVNADVDELDLIVDKSIQNCSGYIGDDQGEAKFRAYYQEKKMAYLANVPSERMLITTVYEGIDSIDQRNIQDHITT